MKHLPKSIKLLRNLHQARSLCYINNLSQMTIKLLLQQHTYEYEKIIFDIL